jgi:hypothetical protein
MIEPTIGVAIEKQAPWIVH